MFRACGPHVGKQPLNFVVIVIAWKQFSGLINKQSAVYWS